MKSPARLLIVDDEPNVAASLRLILEELGCEVLLAYDATCACEILKTRTVDVILSDINMPGMKGTELLTWLNTNLPDTKLIFLTGYPETESAAFGVRAGALDYFTKPFDPIEIQKSVLRALETGRRRLIEKYHDSLTGLPGFRTFREILRTKINGEPVNAVHAIFLIDLHGLGFINNSLGHDEGDRVLKSVARDLLTFEPERTTVARVGGDIFIMLVEDVEKKGAGLFAELLLERIQRRWGPEEHFLSASIGVSLYPADGGRVQDLIDRAENALANARRKTRLVHFFDPIEANGKQSRRLMEQRLRRALDRGLFRLYYQPKQDLRTGELVGAEALVRLVDQPDAPGPAVFIPVAEETGLILPLTEWIVNEVGRMLAARHEQGLPVVPIAINFSPRILHQVDLAARLESTLREFNLSRSCLEIELTETVMLERDEVVLANLRAIEQLRIPITLDDFGTGYSSLSNLRHFPIQKLKIDRGFVREILENPVDRAIVDASIRLGTALGLKIIAEGVETTEQLELLRSIGCDEIQGYLFSRPLPEEEFHAFAERIGPAALRLC